MPRRARRFAAQRRITTRDAGSRTAPRTADDSSLHLAWVLAWVVFALACVWSIAVARAEAPAPSSAPAAFVVDVPGVDAVRIPPVPHLVLRDDMPPDALRLDAFATRVPLGHARFDALLVALDPARAPDRVGIGRTVHLSGHRRLVLDLTPSPRHCAPLVELDF